MVLFLTYFKGEATWFYRQTCVSCLKNKRVKADTKVIDLRNWWGQLPNTEVVKAEEKVTLGGISGTHF